MNAPFSSEHPYWFVRELVAAWPDPIESLGFSYYRYLPQSLEDPRKEFNVSTARFLDPIEMSRVLDDTPHGCELAFHSQVKLARGRVMHVPLIDMSTGSPAQLEKLRPFLGELYSRFQWYSSGRSFHGYAKTLVDVDTWAATLGALLLANQKGLPPTVDPRWIGHRLIAGYSALRWTKNTDYYLELPRIMRQQFLSHRHPE
ncbi:hypothetical protein [Limnobacter sp. SAORIC-690]|jgi:hypothetical protein|uniref:primase 1D-like protein n=1 Tax=Limnobacter sp. SAORIC-690 TaxID=1923970 RepID=UPI0011B03CF4|nr:hypothetical protein [Limnobacter sp. SAORIC-690]